MAAKVAEVVLVTPQRAGMTYEHLHTVALEDAVLELGTEFAYSIVDGVPAYSHTMIARIITIDSQGVPASGAVARAPFQGEYTSYFNLDAVAIDGSRAIVLCDPHNDGPVYTANVVEYVGGTLTWGDWCLVSGSPGNVGQSDSIVPADQREEDTAGWFYDNWGSSFPDICVLADGSAVAGFIIRAIDNNQPGLNIGLFHIALRHLSIDGVTVSTNGKIKFLDAGIQMYGPPGYNSRYTAGMARMIGGKFMVASFYSLRHPSDTSLDQEFHFVQSVEASGTVITPGTRWVLGHLIGGAMDPSTPDPKWWGLDAVTSLPNGAAAITGYGPGSPSADGSGLVSVDPADVMTIQLFSLANAGVTGDYVMTGNLEDSANSSAPLTPAGGLLLADYGYPVTEFAEVKVTGTPEILQRWTWDMAAIPSPAVPPANEYEIVPVGRWGVVIWIDDAYSTRGVTVFEVGPPEQNVRAYAYDARTRFT